MTNIPLWLCIPFAGLLLCIAILPLVKGEWWEKNQPYAVIAWSLLFIIPFAVKFGAASAAETVLECLVNDYLTFIVLLFGLFCVAGNIKLEGNLIGNPIVNVVTLAVGTLFSSWIGTTGASMLFVRPIIQMNSWRKNKKTYHDLFIFLVSNIGGCLTPIGDPPLLMGFSRGVPFFWSMRLMPVLILNMVILLTMFYFLDRKAYQKDIAMGLMPEIKEGEPLIRIKGAHNFLFIVLIVIAVILSGVLPGLSVFQNAAGEVLSLPIFGEVRLSVPSIIEIVLILLAAFLSFKTTPKEVRVQNHFTWGRNPGSCSIIYRNFHHNAAGSYDLKECGSKPWTFTPIPDVLGNRCIVKFPRQYSNIPCIPDNSGIYELYKWNCHNTWNCTGKNAHGNIMWCSIYGSKHIHWKCSKLYG